MKMLSVHELQANPSAVTSLIKAGEEIALIQEGEELARIIPSPRQRNAPRPIGLAKGQFEVPDDFNEPLSEEVLRAFEGR